MDTRGRAALALRSVPCPALRKFTKPAGRSRAKLISIHWNSRQLQERNPFFWIIICLTHVNLWRHTSKLFVWESVDLRIFLHRYSCWDGWRKIPFPCLFSSNPVSKAKSFLPQSEKLVECTFWRWAGHRIGQIPLLPGPYHHSIMPSLHCLYHHGEYYAQ